MANQIRLKRASGSDPGASDLVLGEPAVRTDTGEIFLKKDDGSIAKVAGGIDDGDKGDITVSNSGATFTIDNGVISTAKIADDAVNSDKLASGLLLSAGTNKNIRFSGGIGEIGSVTGFQAVNDAENANTDFGIRATTIRLATGSAERLRVKNAGIDVTGNITVSGTVDGRDVATDGSKLDGIASGATNVTNTNQLTNGAGFITATLTNEQVQDIVGGMVSGNTESGITVTYQDSDGTLDFSVASQTDNNFTNADHSKLDGIEAGATADQSASEILTLLKTVDGSGSGLDADTLDGISSGSFVRSDADDTLNGQYTISDSANEKLILSGSSSPYIRFQESTTNKAYIGWSSSGYIRLVNQETNEELRIQSGSNGLKFGVDGTFYNVWHQLNDGAGSGLDADSVDGIAGSSLLRSDTADTASGDITFSGGAGAATIAGGSDIRFSTGGWTGNSTKIQHHNNSLYIQGGSGANNAKAIIFRADGGSDRWYIHNNGHFYPNVDGTYDIGSSSIKVRVGYLNEVDSGEVRVNNGILETKAAIATSHTLATGFNALAVSPTINNGVTITVPSGAVWAIV